MDSFVLAETFKYLYLLFAESDDLIINIDEYLFTTEGHLLPLYLSVQPQNYTDADKVKMLRCFFKLIIYIFVNTDFR